MIIFRMRILLQIVLVVVVHVLNLSNASFMLLMAWRIKFLLLGRADSISPISLNLQTLVPLKLESPYSRIEILSASRFSPLEMHCS